MADTPLKSLTFPGLTPRYTIPQNTSDLTNDSGFVDAAGAALAAPMQSVNGQTGDVVLDTVYCGTVAPTDPNVNVWVDPSGTPNVSYIPAPSSPATGAFLVWSGSAWVAQTLATWQGGSY